MHKNSGQGLLKVKINLWYRPRTWFPIVTCSVRNFYDQNTRCGCFSYWLSQSCQVAPFSFTVCLYLGWYHIVLKLESVSPLTLFFFIKIVLAILGTVVFFHYLISLFNYSVVSDFLARMQTPGRQRPYLFFNPQLYLFYPQLYP